MLTALTVKEIVRGCIHEVTGAAGTFNAKQRLKAAGIDSSARLKRFKSMIVKDVARRKYTIAASDLDFDQNAVIQKICQLIAAEATQLKKRARPSAAKRGVAKWRADNKAQTKIREETRRKEKGGKKVKEVKRRQADPSAGSNWGTLSGRAKKGAKKLKKSRPLDQSSGFGGGRFRFRRFSGFGGGGGIGGGGGFRSRLFRDIGGGGAFRTHVSRRTKKAAKSVKKKSKGARPIRWQAANLGRSRGGASVPSVSGRTKKFAKKARKSTAPGRSSRRHLIGKRKKIFSPAFITLHEAQQQATRTVDCTPQLEIRKELVPAKTYRIAVFVDQGPAAPGAEVQRLKVQVPQNVKYFPVDVWLDCSSHFSVEDTSNPPRISVNTETGISNEMGFTLKVLKSPDGHPMFVSAFFRYNERPCGKITRYLKMANGSLRWKDFVSPAPTEGEVVLPNADAPPSVVVETDAAPADIRIEVLRILKPELDDGRHFNLKCYTPQGKWEDVWTLPEVTKDMVNTFMKKFMSAKGNARIASLKGAGMDFWDKVPVEVGDLIWNALENGARTMSVISEEPYIPWELMVPYKTLPNPREPLGVELQLGRWITGNYKSATQHIPMKSAYIISPKTSGLDSAALEVAFLTQQLKPQFDPGAPVSPTTFDGVDKGLAGPPRNVVHFVCHGKSAALQTLELDAPDTLDCSQVRTLKGFQAAFKGGPLAFLNACEVGGQVPVLDGVGGFANSFIQLGASAVIAPLWAVQDKAAFSVTQIFYPQALNRVPFAKIMQQIRAKAYDEAIDSYAAYCFYGDPMASAIPI